MPSVGLEATSTKSLNVATQTRMTAKRDVPRAQVVDSYASEYQVPDKSITIAPKAEGAAKAVGGFATRGFDYQPRRNHDVSVRNKFDLLPTWRYYYRDANSFPDRRHTTVVWNKYSRLPVWRYGSFYPSPYPRSQVVAMWNSYGRLPTW